MQIQSGVKTDSLNWLFLLQKQVLRIISFECKNALLNPLFRKTNQDKTNQDRSSLKIALLSVNLLILIFHHFSSIGLPIPQTLIGIKYLVLQKDS